MNTKSQSKEQVVQEFRVQSIKDAALRVIARKGVTGASMQEIALEAGVAKGTIYLYFQNQQELIERTVDHALSQLLATLAAVLEQSSPVEETLRSLTRTTIEFFNAHHDVFQFYNAMHFSGAPGDHCDRRQRPQFKTYLDRLTRFFATAMKRGEVRQCDARRLAIFVQEGIIAVILHRLEEKNPPAVDDEVDFLISTISEGISKKRSRH